ncbi:MAG: SDR family NAD(P)-dependent oxidoreductase [Proteobacteria bacterium]|nr:SDR family NAD(P)-dependent oxidoreductase [Pseudomonadota bacterium]
MAEQGSVVIVGVGPGLGAALGRRFAAAGHAVMLASRTLDKVEAIAKEINNSGGNAHAIAVDALDEASVVDLIARADGELGPLEVAIYNASGRVRKSVVDIEADEFIEAWQRSCLGGFLLGREAARRMTKRGRGSILFTGATASVKAFAKSAGFAVGKFGLRALAQSMARDLHPQGIHVGHFVIDGGISVDQGEARLDPDAIAETYYQFHTQPKSIWAWEIELRPWVENF